MSVYRFPIDKKTEFPVKTANDVERAIRRRQIQNKYDFSSFRRKRK